MKRSASLHPVENVEPDEIPELDLAHPGAFGSIPSLNLLMDAVWLSLAPGDDPLVSSTRSRIEFEPTSRCRHSERWNCHAHDPSSSFNVILPVVNCSRFEFF